MYTPFDPSPGDTEWRDLTFMQRVNRRVVAILLLSVMLTVIVLAPVWGVLIGSILGDTPAFIGGALGIGVWLYAGAALVEHCD